MSLAERDDLCSTLGGKRWPYAPLLAQLPIARGADVLDIGAGEGHGLRELARSGHRGRRCGIDPSPGPGVQAGHAQTLPYASGSFDVALLVRTLAHLPDPVAALREAVRVLRPGGRLVVASHGPRHLQKTWQALGHLPPSAGPDAALRRALSESGYLAWRLDIWPAVEVDASAAQKLAALTGLSLDIDSTLFPLRDQLHLAAYVHHRE